MPIEVLAVGHVVHTLIRGFMKHSHRAHSVQFHKPRGSVLESFLATVEVILDTLSDRHFSTCSPLSPSQLPQERMHKDIYSGKDEMLFGDHREYQALSGTASMLL